MPADTSSSSYLRRLGVHDAVQGFEPGEEGVDLGVNLEGSKEQLKS